MRRTWETRLLMTMTTWVAVVSCDAVLGIQQYGPGPTNDGGDSAVDGTLPDGGPDSGSEAGPCTPGDKRCSINSVETCDSSKTWGGATPCSSSQTCSGGRCFVTPPSCAAGGLGAATCGNGGAGMESCCTTRQDVPGGTFDRSYDGLSSGFTSTAFQATVSAFRLDAYEVTVGRFRRFVEAAVAGWRPAAGSGKHTHLNGGNGLAATASGNEPGWDSSWNANLATTSSGWNANLSGGTWTATAGANENLPIAGIDWYEAYAFCIWDRGFLPSEAEWNDAATGGNEQRALPWSPAYPPGSTAISCSEANYSGPCPARTVTAVGRESPAGDGRWGQSDLAGNVWEWNLDWFGPYSGICENCANVTSGSDRVVRGGSFLAPALLVLTSFRNHQTPLHREADIGVRCARTP